MTTKSTYDTGVLYNTDEAKALPEGMYLGLFHGRNTPDEELDGWGFEGPVLGPIKWCHTTYASHVRFCPAGDYEHDGIDLKLNGDLVEYDGKFYGDWSVFYHKPKSSIVNETTKVFLSRETRLNLLTSALEGGSNYWYFLDTDAHDLITAAVPYDNKTSFVDRLFKALEMGISVSVKDIKNDENDEHEHLGFLTLSGMAEGENLMLEESPVHFADIISESDDATTADVWFQFAVMKEIVYG